MSPTNIQSYTKFSQERREGTLHISVYYANITLYQDHNKNSEKAPVSVTNTYANWKIKKTSWLSDIYYMNASLFQH